MTVGKGCSASMQGQGFWCALSGSKMVEMLASVMPTDEHVALALENGTSGELKMVKAPLTHLPAPQGARSESCSIRFDLPSPRSAGTLL